MNQEQKIEMNIPGLQKHVSLAPYTTFRIGGPARYFVVARSKADMLNAVQQAARHELKWWILGGGSDVLVSDNGFDGLVIKAELRGIEFDETTARVRAEAGVRLSQLITQSAQRGVRGMEYAIGVPATVGGAVWANLGARGREIKDVLVETTVMNVDGTERVLTNAECKFGYRDSIFKHEPMVILDAVFQLEKGDVAEIKANVQELSKMRKETQDIGSWCAGCVFRNPKDQTDVPAAKLIDDLGLKGFTIGGAQVSPIHANFIINTGNATAEDVVMLISYVKQQVRDRTGVQLMEEIEYVGF